MKEYELAEVMKTLQGLFAEAELTEQEIALWSRRLSYFSMDDAIHAIEDHYNERPRKRPHLGSVIEILRRTRNESKTTSDNEPKNWAEMLTRWGRRREGESDADLICRYYRACWERSGGSPGYRRKFQRECYASLFNAGIPPEEADARAQQLTEDEIPV